jgi:hypothetical protein
VHKIEENPGFEPCNVLLQCVKADPCDICRDEFADHCEKLKLGRVYRATAKLPMVGTEDKGWYIPELCEGPQTFLYDGVLRVGVILWCPPHFGELIQEQNSEVTAMILSCKDKVPETEDA